jgi:hypothetical protein
MKKTKTRLNYCLECNAKLDAASGINCENAPKPGAITICLYCGHLMAFADDLSFRQLNDAEMHWIAGDKNILLVQKIRGEMKKEGGRK